MARLTPYELIKITKKAKSAEIAPILVRLGYLKADNSDTFICPYHSEKSGSFKSSPKYQIFKCFGCNKSIDGVTLYADFLIKETLGDKIFHLSPKEQSIEKSLCMWRAAINIASELGIINIDERISQETQLQGAINAKVCPKLYYEETDSTIVTQRGELQEGFYLQNNSKKEETFLEVAQKKIGEYKDITIASRQELHFVYTLFREAVEHVRGFRLFPHHLNHLKEARRLSDEEIFINGYFSHPTTEEKPKIMGKLIELITKNGGTPQILSGVPGFKYNQNKLRYEIGTSYDAIFIPLWDIYGNTHREQLRTELKSKYLWFTVKELGHCKTPSSTIYPFKKNFNDLISRRIRLSDFARNLFLKLSEQMNKPINIDDDNEVVLIFSEGHFKTYELAKAFNAIGITIQGLSSWSSGAAAIIKAILAITPYNMRVGKVIIAFDSDTKVKNGLFDNGKYLSKVLRNEGIETYYLTWDSKYGKGFDDVIFNYQDPSIFSLVSDIEHEEKYDTIISLISLQYQKPAKDLTTDEIEPYYEALEKLPIQRLKETLEKTKLVNLIIQKRFKENVSNPGYNNEIQNATQMLLSQDISQLQMINNQMN